MALLSGSPDAAESANLQLLLRFGLKLLDSRSALYSKAISGRASSGNGHSDTSHDGNCSPAHGFSGAVKTLTPRGVGEGVDMVDLAFIVPL